MLAQEIIRTKRDGQALSRAQIDDFVAQGKAALANPDWPAKVQAGASLADFDFGMFSPLADLASQAAWEAAQ